MWAEVCVYMCVRLCVFAGIGGVMVKEGHTVLWLTFLTTLLGDVVRGVVHDEVRVSLFVSDEDRKQSKQKVKLEEQEAQFQVLC